MIYTIHAVIWVSLGESGQRFWSRQKSSSENRSDLFRRSIMARCPFLALVMWHFTARLSSAHMLQVFERTSFPTSFNPMKICPSNGTKREISLAYSLMAQDAYVQLHNGLCSCTNHFQLQLQPQSPTLLCDIVLRIHEHLKDAKTSAWNMHTGYSLWHPSGTHTLEKPQRARYKTSVRLIRWCPFRYLLRWGKRVTLLCQLRTQQGEPTKSRQNLEPWTLSN